MMETEPRNSVDFFFLSWPGFCASEPWPLTLAINSFFPSGETTTAPGYQPVGIRPATALDCPIAPGAGLLTLPSSRPKVSLSPSHDLAPSRTTATQLFVPLATYKV